MFEEKAAEHWKYIDGVLKLDGVSPELRKKIGWHYMAAMIHGWGHGYEDASNVYYSMCGYKHCSSPCQQQSMKKNLIGKGHNDGETHTQTISKTFIIPTKKNIYEKRGNGEKHIKNKDVNQKVYGDIN